ncbi:hypothetical protein ACEPAI_1429 [Sanghuangporus weigelae]
MPSGQKDRDKLGSELRTVRIRELELKRISGDISCAECRRLKLKCDKKVPCSSCVRRGCRHVCPTETAGSTMGNSTRHKSSTQVQKDSSVSRKLTAMSERIRILEHALHIQDGDSHPLLAPELLAIKQSITVADRSTEDCEDNTVDDEDDADEKLVSAFGTLTVSEGKTMRFLGPSAADSVLLMEMLDRETGPYITNSERLPEDLVHASEMWPFVPTYISRSNYSSQLCLQLPLYERAISLTESYFANLVWFDAVVDRSQLVDEVIPQFYPQHHPAPPESADISQSHDLALLFAVLSCGAISDLTQPVINPEAERYQRLARAALGMQSILDFGSLEAVQTLFLMSAYEGYTRRKTSQESADRLSSMGLSIAASIGLHLDPSRWNLDAKLSNRRRRIFWEINATDKWKSLGSGRPFSFPPDTIDCEFPLDSGATVDVNGNCVESVWQWKYRFTRHVLGSLAGKICSARPLKYSEVLSLDKLVREFRVHPHVSDRAAKSYVFATDGNYGNLPPHVTVWWKETALLFVHKHYFARAMLEYSDDPLRSPFVPSVLSAYRSSVTLLGLLYNATVLVPLVTERLWGQWSFSLGCTMIIGAVACRSSTTSIFESALKALETAIGLFKAGAEHSVARAGLDLSCRLRDRAISVNQARRQGHSPLTSSNREEPSSAQLRIPGISQSGNDSMLDEEGLDILRGTTRYVDQRTTSFNRTLDDHRQGRIPMSNSQKVTSSSVTKFHSGLDTSSSSANAIPTSNFHHSRDFNYLSTKGSLTFTYDDYFSPFSEIQSRTPSSAVTQSVRAHSRAEPSSLHPQTGQPETAMAANHSQHLPLRPQGSVQLHPFPLQEHVFAGSSITTEVRHQSQDETSLNPFYVHETRLVTPFDDASLFMDYTDSFFSAPVPGNLTLEELDALCQMDNADGSKSWNTFVQQMHDDTSTGNRNWDQ